MTTAAQPNEDGALKPALRALEDAIHALTAPTTAYINDELRTGPSLYMQLWDAVSGEQQNSGSGGSSKSRPPMWLDAFDLCNEIDVAVEVWQPAFTGVPPTVGRLNCILTRGWRPQDCHGITQITEAIRSWVASIDELMNPTPKWSLPNPCPSCGTAIVYRKDTGGDMLRKPALSIGPDGCTCAKCHAVWTPDRFVFLSKVLGYEFDNGILE